MPPLPTVCVETPAHASISSICSGGFITSPPGPIEDETIAEASAIDSIIYQLNDNADAAAEAALIKITALTSLSPPALPGVSYEAPTWTTPALHSVVAPSLALTGAPAATNSVIWPAPALNDAAQPVDSIVAPTTTLPTVPDVPTLSSAAITAPEAPAEYAPGALVAPEYVAPTLSLGTVDTPVLEEVTITVPAPVGFDALSYTIDFASIDAAIDRASNIAVPANVIPEYVQLIPEVFTVVGGMTAGEAVNTTLVLLDDVQGRAVAPMLTRRGLDVPANVVAFDTWVQTTMDEYSADSATLFSAEYRDEVINASFSLASAAEEILVKIDLGLYDARFEYSIEEAKAQLLRAKSIVASYNAEVAKVEALVLEYNASLVALRAQTEAVMTQAEVAKLVGGTNTLVARQFTIEEEAAQGDVKVFRAQIAGEAAKLTAQKALIDAIDVKLAQAQATMLGYTSETVQYEAEVQKVKDVFSSYVTGTRAISEENDMTRAQVRGGTASLKAVASQASSAASAAAVEAIRKVRVSKSDEAFYVAGGAVNDVAKYSIAGTQSEYTQGAAQMRVNAAVDSVEPASISDVGRAVSRFTRIALESSGRAASMAQRANDSLVRAYAAAYETAGRAGAAVASGKLSGFRASAALTASGNIGASRTKAEAYAASGSTQYSERDTASETITV